MLVVKVQAHVLIIECSGAKGQQCCHSECLLTPLVSPTGKMSTDCCCTVVNQQGMYMKWIHASDQAGLVGKEGLQDKDLFGQCICAAVGKQGLAVGKQGLP